MNIQVTMFQSFTIKYGDITLEKDKIKSDKLIKLLSYLIYYYNRKIPSSELIDLIWYFEDIDNPIGALKNLIYRLRTILKQELGVDDLIITGKSSYCMNEKYTFDIDAHMYEYYNKMLTDDEDPNLYEKMIELYHGKFLLEFEDDHRVLSRSAYFHSLFLSRVGEYAKLLENKKDYKRIENIARKAIAIDELDEGLYIILIKGLHYQGCYQQAVDTYKKATDLLYRSLGTNPSQEMRELYEMIKKEQHTESTIIEDIQKGLTGEPKYGAYLCEYGAFRDLYNLQARMMTRLSVCSHLCVVTIIDNSRYEVDKEKNHVYVEKTMKKIQSSLVDGLRVGDVVSRFSVNQFVILLPVCNYENSVFVMDRTLKKIKRALNNKNINIEVDIKEVGVLEIEGV